MRFWYAPRLNTFNQHWMIFLWLLRCCRHQLDICCMQSCVSLSASSRVSNNSSSKASFVLDISVFVVVEVVVWLIVHYNGANLFWGIVFCICAQLPSLGQRRLFFLQCFTGPHKHAHFFSAAVRQSRAALEVLAYCLNAAT